MSRGSLVESRASTWMVTANTLGPEVSHSTSMMRFWSRRRLSALGQSSRWTLTPWPRVTKPMIGSRGTGVQQRASFTQTSSGAATTTPQVAGWGRGLADGPLQDEVVVLVVLLLLALSRPGGG